MPFTIVALNCNWPCWCFSSKTRRSCRYWSMILHIKAMFTNCQNISDSHIEQVRPWRDFAKRGRTILKIDWWQAFDSTRKPSSESRWLPHRLLGVVHDMEIFTFSNSNSLPLGQHNWSKFPRGGKWRCSNVRQILHGGIMYNQNPYRGYRLHDQIPVVSPPPQA